MGRPKLYHTPDEKAAAKRRDKAKWQNSERGQAKRAAWQASHPDLMQASYARYRQTEGYRVAQRRYRESWKAKETAARYQTWAKENDPLRIKARAAIMIALHRGDMTRPVACEHCSRPVRPDAHHFLGYEPKDWLTVIWLCRVCHKAAHS